MDEMLRDPAVRPMREVKPGVAVITGGSSGIGRATAQYFAEQGWDVGLIARDEQGLAETRTDVERRGRRAAVFVADVTDTEALERAATAIEEELGEIAVWINNAGVSFYGAFLDITEEEFRRVTDVTYMGTVNGSRVALRRMMALNRGTIVNVGSAIAYRGAPLQTPYSGAKYAVRGFTEALRSELMSKGSAVHLTMVHPPSVNTPFFSHAGARMDGMPRALPPVYEPEVIARAIHLAATTRRREVKVTSATVQFALLNALAPSLADRLLGMFGVGTQVTHRSDVAELRDPALFDAPRHLSSVRGAWPGRRTSAQLWAAEHRGAVLAAGLVGLAASLAIRGRGR
jgi:short-subunit dehydrogenase